MFIIQILFSNILKLQVLKNRQSGSTIIGFISPNAG